MKFYPYQPSSWQITIPGLKGVVGFLVRIENSELPKTKKKVKTEGLSNHYSLLFTEFGVNEVFTKDEEEKAIAHAHSLIREKIIAISQNV